MTHREHVEALVSMFGRYVAERDDDANRAHLRVASELLRLLNEEEPAAADVDALLRDLETVGWAGSATIDLQHCVASWATRARRVAILRHGKAG